LALGAPAATASAQTEEPPPEYFSASGPWLERFGLTPYGDLRLRGDRVRDRPATTDDLRRVRGFVRAGLFWAPHPRLALQAGLYSGLWQTSEDLPAARFDNEWGDSLAVDRLAAVIDPAPWLTLTLGKHPLPLATTELTWDGDLRPVGATALLRRAIGAYDQARLGAAAVRRARPGDDDALVAVQLGYAFRPGAARGAEIVLGFFDYDGLDHLAREGLGRQNRLVVTSAGLAYANDFRMIEAQLVGRAQIGALPVAASVHAVRNQAVDQEGDGIRARATLGDLEAWPRAELAYVYQRIEREALPGAFNSDDWWFHTRARGHRVWIAGRLAPWAELRVSGNMEWRDDVSTATRRLLVDLRLRLPGE
jgi:hypothetical protein